jgi:HIRAN domain
MPADNRRAGDEIRLPVFLGDGGCTVEVADGTMVGVGFKPFLDEDRTVELIEDEESPVLPGVFYTRVAGASFHDDALRLAHFAAGQHVEIRPEPANPLDRNALAVFGGGVRVGYIPAPIAKVLAPSGTRVGRGTVMMEWSTNGVRHDIWILGSMRVTLAFASEE